MTTLRNAAMMALEALESLHSEQNGPPLTRRSEEWGVAMTDAARAITTLRKALDAESMASLPEPKPYWVTERQIDRNEIVKMARAAGFFYSSGGSEYMLCRIPNLERLTALIVAAEREWKGLVDTEPVAWMVYTMDGSSVFVTDNPKDFTENHRALPLYTAPPRREWQSLTDEEIKDIWCWDEYLHSYQQQMIEDIQAKLKEKNT